MTDPGGWHHAHGKRHLTANLSLSWRHDNGAEIYQGRPAGKRFVYRVRLSNGQDHDFTMLVDAKGFGAIAILPAPEQGVRADE